MSFSNRPPVPRRLNLLCNTTSSAQHKGRDAHHMGMKPHKRSNKPTFGRGGDSHNQGICRRARLLMQATCIFFPRQGGNTCYESPGASTLPSLIVLQNMGVAIQANTTGTGRN